MDSDTLKRYICRRIHPSFETAVAVAEAAATFVVNIYDIFLDCRQMRLFVTITEVEDEEGEEKIETEENNTIVVCIPYSRP